ncbi:MAG: NAD-dependent deacetylase [Rubrivivax sp.]|jgi:NAD-dependent SIR2 family protein deacetylase|nr:NAD-dependent deacetylase [Rubrivivax sp.]
MELDPDAIGRAAGAIVAADALLITAGAGMGVDSGLPDFRGNEGFWRAYPAIGRRGLRFDEVADAQSFKADPALAWGFYGHRLALYRDTVPHAGFGLLGRWGERMRHGCGVFTSNVDGQFQRAGFASARLAECHGSIHHLQCSVPCSEDIWPADDFVPEVDMEQCRLVNKAPTCPRCGAVARPNILMFGDCDWLDERTRDQQTRLDRWLAGTRRVVVVEIGAGTAIPSVRRFSQTAAAARDAVLVRINPREPAVPRSRDVSIGGPALAALQAIDDRLSA